jgi:hypothetical protein
MRVQVQVRVGGDECMWRCVCVVMSVVMDASPSASVGAPCHALLLTSKPWSQLLRLRATKICLPQQRQAAGVQPCQ